MGDAPAMEIRATSDDGWFEAHVEIDAADPSRLMCKVPGVDEDGASEVFTSKEEVKSRVRFPSDQVHDKDCGGVKEGDHLCALNNTPTSSRYYDATVLKVERHEHAKNRGMDVCQCEFLVKWSQGPDKGETSVVGCECLCRINATLLDTHPVVAKYLSS